MLTKATSFLLALLLGCGARRLAAPSHTSDPPGAAHFQAYCAACHSYDDGGMGNAPPLDASPWIVGPETRLIRIVLHGLRGRMEVAGKAYDQEMPGFGAVLSDEDVSALLSYVRQRFGRPSPPISAAAVSQVRAAEPGRTRYWDVAELDQP